ncbi:MAG TPA: nodulation protein NfeD [Gaiellaceae bacterium]|jgi:membrane-bound serine protease (ClpP class)
MRSFLRISLAAALVVLAAGGAIANGAQNERPRVLAVEFQNDVNPVTQDYLNAEIDRAQKENYNAVVILMDTPGGLDSSMRAIVKKELASTVPVVVYVYPPGSRAASAGVFITMAADVAAMAPQTNIGSSTPISTNGQDIGKDLRRKVVNDAAAAIGELAREHGRNAEWAENAVRKASNLGATEALEQNVIDVMAPNLPALLNTIDGMKTKPKGLVLHTANATVDTVHMSVWKRILDTLIDPNIIVLLMSIGVLGITVEVLNPGLILPGTVGAISLIVGLYGLQVLPVSAAGILLMLLALGFFAAEAFVTAHGAIALAGAVSFVIGSLLLFDPAGSAYQVSLPVAIAIGGTLAILIAFAATKAIQARRARPKTGSEELHGEIGVVREALDPDGLVFVHGEIWRATAADGPIPAGAAVVVDSLGDDLRLSVRRAHEETPAAAPV